jgi:hypothetical protein
VRRIAAPGVEDGSFAQYCLVQVTINEAPTMTVPLRKFAGSLDDRMTLQLGVGAPVRTGWGR